MKRVLCFLLVLAVLSTSLVAVTGYSLIKESDNVSFTLIDEWGDRRYLRGVTAEMDFTYNNKLNWNVRFSPPVGTKTEYSYNTFNELYNSTASNYGMSSASYNVFDLKNENPKMQEVIDELKAGVREPGEIRKAQIKLREFYEYYPVRFNLRLPDISVTWRTGIGIDDKGKYDFEGISPLRGQELLNAFNKYFRISVFEEDVREISVHAHEDGSFSYRTSHTSTFDFEFLDAVFSDCIYFSFNNERTKHFEGETQLVDTSLIPGGYGIYSVPYGDKDVKYEEIRTVYSIPSDATVEALYGDEERNELFLCLHENGKYVLHVIDTLTMTDKEVIELFSFSYDEYVRVEQNEDFFVFIKNDVDLNVVERNAEGKYKSALTGAMPSGIIADREYFSYRSRFGFDGERLVVLVIEEAGYGEIDIMSIQPDIMVFTKDGIQYYCKWSCSLGDPIAKAYRWESVHTKDWKITVE